MDVQTFIAQLTSEAMMIVIIISLPAILASLSVGLAVALFSATTQIQEQTLSFAPKMVIVYVVLGAAGTWIGSLLFRYATKCLTEFAYVIH